MRQSEITAFKAKANIVDIVSASGIELKKSGKDYSALCPFHDEKTPSFTVSPEKQIFHCFGCGVGGDVIEFLMRMDGIDFQSAINRIGGNSATEKKTSRTKRERFRLRKAKSRELKESEMTNTMLDELYEWGHYQLDWVNQIQSAMRLFNSDMIFSLSELVSGLSAVKHNIDVVFNGDNENRYMLYKELKENGDLYAE